MTILNRAIACCDGLQEGRPYRSVDLGHPHASGSKKLGIPAPPSQSLGKPWLHASKEAVAGCVNDERSHLTIVHVTRLELT